MGNARKARYDTIVETREMIEEREAKERSEVAAMEGADDDEPIIV